MGLQPIHISGDGESLDRLSAELEAERKKKKQT
jgi:hypothetical protein